MAPDRLAAEHLLQVLPLLRFRAAGNDGRAGMVECDEAKMIVRRIGTCVFLVPDQLPCEGKSEAAVFLWPRNARPPAFILSLLPGEVEFAHGLAGVRTSSVRSVAVQPVPGFLTENLVFAGKLQIHLAPPVYSAFRFF